jgi:hypothetical protein
MPRGNIGALPERGGGGGQKCMRIGPDHTRPDLDTCQLWTLAWALIEVRVCSDLEPWGPAVGSSDPIQGDLDPILGVRSIHVGVLVQTWRFGSYIQRSGTLPWGSGLTVDALEYITFSGHVAASEPSTWWVGCYCWPRVVTRGWGESRPGPTHNSFTTRLKLATWLLCLHTVVRGTLVLGYRHVGRNLDRNGQTLTYLPYSDPFLKFS